EFPCIATGAVIRDAIRMPRGGDYLGRTAAPGRTGRRPRHGPDAVHRDPDAAGRPPSAVGGRGLVRVDGPLQPGDGRAGWLPTGPRPLGRARQARGHSPGDLRIPGGSPPAHAVRGLRHGRGSPRRSQLVELLTTEETEKKEKTRRRFHPFLP